MGLPLLGNQGQAKKTIFFVGFNFQNPLSISLKGCWQRVVPGSQPIANGIAVFF
jgi:hypothetical protein